MSPEQSSPSRVAVAFAEALYGGRFNDASRLMIPSQIEAFKLIINDLSPKSLRATGVKVGTETVSANSATVYLLGTFCSTGNKRSIDSVGNWRSLCVTDERLGSHTFAIRVLLSDGRWFVGTPDR
jgi:hypothetical protein